MSDNTSCCQEDFKTLKKFAEHVLNVHAGRVPLVQDPWPDHDHRHFKCCGQFFHGEEAFRLHVARAHAGVDVDDIRELRRHMEGRVPDELKEDKEEDGAGEETKADAKPDAAAGGGEEDEVDLSDLPPKQRAIQKAKLIAKRKKQQQGG